MIKINAGCGVGLKKGFINIDKFFTGEDIIRGFETKVGHCKNANVEKEDDGSYPIFYQADICDMRLPSDYADYILCDNVIEHLPMGMIGEEDGCMNFCQYSVFHAINEMHRVLKPEGTIAMITPDFNGVAKMWLDYITPQTGSFTDWDLFKYIAEIVYGNQAGAGEMHKTPMTADLLNMLFKSVGFERIVVTVYKQGFPGPVCDGCPESEGKLRCDTLFVTAMKANPAAYAGDLSFVTGSASKVKGGLV